MEEIVKSFKVTGILEINVDAVVKKWNHLWAIAQWGDKYRLVKFRRKDSSITTFKVSISEVQAKEIINRMSLNKHEAFFASATTWK